MWNLGAGEVMAIMLLALIVLGPQKLPDAARSVGRFTAEVRRMSNGFRAEMQQALDAAEESDARAKGAALVAGDDGPDLEPAAAESIEPAEPADDP